MSDVKRYDPINSDGTCGMCIEDADYGAYVEYADYAALEAELAKLRQQAQEVVMPPLMPSEPFTTIDRGSKNFKAGWNACVQEFARLNKGAGSHE